MNYFNDNAYYFGLDWFIWVMFVFFIFSSFGNWGYTYRTHRKFDNLSTRDSTTILNERYAAGELTRAQYLELKSDIATA